MSTALILLAEGFEELEAVTVMDLLVRGGVNVIRAGLTPGPIKASRHTVIQPDVALDEVLDESFDMVVLPGGLPGADHLAGDERVIALLQQQKEAGRWIAAICAAPRALLASGVVKGCRMTAYPGALEGFDVDGVEILDVAVEVDGRVVTSRGPGTAMDFGLCLVEILEGEEVRDRVEVGLVR